MVGLGRFELPTTGLGNRRSIHLSYSPNLLQASDYHTQYPHGASRFREYFAELSPLRFSPTQALSTQLLCVIIASPPHHIRGPCRSEVIMTRTVRNILIAVGVLIVLLFVIPFFIPVNQFKPTIEEKASAALGRKVQLGNLSLSLLHGALSAQDLSVGDDPKFSPSPFLTAKSLSVGVEIMPLIFSKQLNVTDITIDEPQVTLLRNPAGQWNYSSLGASAKPATKSSSTASASTPEVSVKKLELKDGKIIVGTTTSHKRNTYDHVTVTASDVSMNSKFPVTVSADLPGGGQFKLDGNAGPLDKADTALTPLDAKIHVNSLDLARTGFLDPDRKSVV